MRNNLTVKVPTPDAQKDGWVKWKRLTYGGRKKLHAEYDEIPLLTDKVTFVTQHAFDRLVEWNWTDAEGASLPLPKCDADMDDYTDDEVMELYTVAYRSIIGNLLLKDGELKN